MSDATVRARSHANHRTAAVIIVALTTLIAALALQLATAPQARAIILDNRISADYKGWAKVAASSPLSPVTSTQPAYRWSGSSWTSTTRTAYERVYLWPYGNGWHWTWSSGRGWLAMRTTSLTHEYTCEGVRCAVLL